MRSVLLLLLLPAASAAAIQPAEAVAVARRDIEAVVPADRPYTRYLWLSAADPKIKWQQWIACSGQANGMSVYRRIVPPPIILNDGTVRLWPGIVADDWSVAMLARLRITDYGWDVKVWERLGDPALEPIFHVYTRLSYPAGYYTNGQSYPAGEEKVIALAPWLLEPLGLPLAAPERAKAQQAFLEAIIGLAGQARSAVPILEADNFVWQTAIQFDRKAGYYDFLGVKNLKDFDRVTGFSEKDSLAFALPLLEAVADSNVAAQARRVEIWEKIGGRKFLTKDQVNQRGQGKRNPLNVVGRNDLDFDASEIFASLPNGWWATGAFSNQGARQDSAPDGVGYHHRSVTNDGKIHVNLACLVCHDAQAGHGGLQPITPFFRNLYVAQGPLALAGVVPIKLLGYEQEYLTPIDTTFDQRRYEAAVFQATGLTPDKYALALYDSFLRWDRPLTLYRAAVLTGASEEEFQKALERQVKTFGVIDNVNGNWLLPPGNRSRIGVDQWAEAFNLSQLYLRGYPVWPKELRMKYPGVK